MRRLVMCPVCSLQYDVSSVPEGDRFRCSCGGVVKVPLVGIKEAGVVRCSSCGAPRRERSTRCGFCSSDFTLHERDLNTICPACMTRISDNSRFCHGCGVAIAPQVLSAEPTGHLCPACGKGHTLTGRKIEADIAFLECRRCGGIWLGHEAFGHLQEKARSKEIRWLGKGKPTEPVSATAQTGPLYRNCTMCGKQMSRRNFEYRSGVIIDVCANHGLWLDLGELDRILHWIQSGARSDAIRFQRLDDREKASLATIQNRNNPLDRAGREEFGRGSNPSTLLGGLIRFLSEE